jgi:hypothetical protein
MIKGEGNLVKYTLGPWKVKYEFNVFSENRVVAACGGHSNNVDSAGVHVENIANAHLCAAAPEMYEALRWLLHLCSGISKGGDECRVTTDEWNEAWNSAIKAVEKAEAGEGN